MTVNRSDLQDGQKVRVTYEGYVRVDQLRRAFVAASRDPHEQLRGIIPDEGLDMQIEVLEEPKPSWWPPQDGDIVLMNLDSDDEPEVVRVRRHSRWYMPGSPSHPSRFTDDDVAEHGTLLVRDSTAYMHGWAA
jgi:hypothetical protein